MTKPQWQNDFKEKGLGCCFGDLCGFSPNGDDENYEFDHNEELKSFINEQIAKAYEDGIVDSVKSAIRSFDDGYKEGLQKALELPATFAEYKFEDPMAPENRRLLQEEFGMGQESGWSHYRHAVFILLQKEKERHEH